MFKHTMIKRSLPAGLVIVAASFPAVAQARFNLNPPGPPSGSAVSVASTPSATRSGSSTPPVTTASQSGFQWGDAGIGAAGGLLLVAIGSGTAVTVRRRSGLLTR